LDPEITQQTIELKEKCKDCAVKMGQLRTKEREREEK
jgi:hypothetical protein